MAWETITYACGHTEQQQFYGKMDGRRRRIAALQEHDCPACRAAGSDLTGSDKQIAWAEDIRPALIAAMTAATDEAIAKYADAPEDKVPAHLKQAAVDALISHRDAWAAEPTAKAWIDRRNSAITWQQLVTEIAGPAVQAAMIA